MRIPLYNFLCLNDLIFNNSCVWHVCLLPCTDELIDSGLNDAAHTANGFSLERDLYSQTTTQEKSQEEIIAINTGVSKEIWLDFEDFCVCFQ